MCARKVFILLMIVVFLFYRTTEAANESSEEVNIVCIAFVLNGLSLDKCIVVTTGTETWTLSRLQILKLHRSLTEMDQQLNQQMQMKSKHWTLDIWYVRINYIPINLKAILPKLRAINFWNVRLLSINHQNMHQFGDSLESVHFGRNQLTSLDGNLFKNNLNLKHISFAENPITHIDRKFFKTLKKMKNIKYVDLSNLKCMDHYYDKSIHGAIAAFKWKNSECF